MTKSSSAAKGDAEQDAEPETEETEGPEDEAGGPEAAETATESEDEPGENAGGDSDVEGEAAATDAADGDGDEPAGTASRAGWMVAAGATAVVSAGLGIASLTGTWLGEVMSRRQELIGQINTSQAMPPADPTDQLAAIYGSPSHTTALFNGFFALAAVIVAGFALLLPVLTDNRGKSPVWVRAVAYGGLALGVVGLVIAAVMWFDVFTDLPKIPPPPEQPQTPQLPGA